MIGILTLNLNYDVDKHGTWDIRSQLVRDLIQEKRPDIVAFQAVRITNGANQAEQLSGMLPDYPHVLFQPAVVHEDGRVDGSAFLACHPIQSGQHLALSVVPGQEDANPRVLLTGVFDVRGEQVRVFNGHFSWVSQQAARNLEEAVPFIQSFNEPALLVGDFNMQPDSPPLERIRRAGFVDAWQALRVRANGEGDPGYTFEAPHPTMRIDYIWASAPLVHRLMSIETVAAPALNHEARLSDHLGLLAVLS